MSGLRPRNRFYQSRLGFSLDQIREAAIHYRCSYGEAEEKLFHEDTHREPTTWDYLKWWWIGRHERRKESDWANIQAIGHADCRNQGNVVEWGSKD